MKTLYNTVQQYESILNPSQDQVMNRMTDDMIRQRIQDYCTSNRQKYKQNELWIVVAISPSIEITVVDKDEKGWYVETKSDDGIHLIDQSSKKSFYDYFLSKGCKIDKQKGFLIEDMGVYFRWRKHEGRIVVMGAPNFSSTQGLPEELEHLHLRKCCQKSGRFVIHNKIKLMVLSTIKDTKISGNGCKNIVIDFDSPCSNITVPDGVKMHHPRGWNEYRALIERIKGH